MSFEIFGRSFHFLSNSNQQAKAIDMLERYIFKPEIVILILILAVYVFTRLIAKVRHKERLIIYLNKLSPWLYLFVIFTITVLNRDFGNRELRLAFDNWFTQTGFHETNVLGFMFNMVLYLPFGFILYKWAAFGQKIWLTFVVITSTSFIIEVLQYVFACGVTAIDDFAANVIGGLIGLGFAIFIKNIKNKSVKAWNRNG